MFLVTDVWTEKNEPKKISMWNKVEPQHTPTYYVIATNQTNGSTEVFTIFWKVCFSKLFQTPKTNSKRTSF